MELKDILGTCTFTFKQRVADLIKFGNKGRLLITKENTSLVVDSKVTEYASKLFTIEDKDLETKIKQALKYSPTKIILFEYKGALVNHIEEIDKLKFDWIISLNSSEQETIADYADERELFGCVYNIKADSKWVVSVNNPSAILANGVTINNSSTITGLDLLPIIGGMLSGCPYTNSVTSYVLDELESVTLPETITNGQLTLYNEEEGVRVASPVNTLITLVDKDTEDMKSITIMEGIRRFKTDQKLAFRTGYKGKKNKYDNQQLFISANKGYIKELEENDILDPEYDNTVTINTDRMRELWISSGKSEEEINSLSDLDVAKRTYKKLMTLKANVKFLDAIEECEIEVEMY